jgi:hypothetical protein
MYVKAVDTDVVINVAYDAAIEGNGVDITAGTYTVANGVITVGAAGNQDVTVKIPKSALTADVELTLDKADHVGDITFKFDGVSVTYKANALPTTWVEVAEKAGKTINSAFLGSYVAEKPAAGAIVTAAGAANGNIAPTITLAAGKEYESGYHKLKVTTDFAATNMANTTGTWTLDGDAVATPTTAFYAKNDSELVCTIETDGTGFEAGDAQFVQGSTGAVAAIKTAYSGGVTAPTGVGTAKLSYTNDVEYKDGAVTLTWTVSGDNENITITVSKGT